MNADELLRLHRELDRTSRTMAGARFLSGWQTSHPLVDRYLSLAGDEATLSDRYSFLSDSAALSDAIRTFHLNVDGVARSSESIFVAPGSSPLLMALFLALPELGIEDVCYVPPVYYSCFYFCRSLGIAIKPISGKLLHDPDASFVLPNRRTALVFCDPIWVLGTTVHPDHLETIRAWQERTGSIVVVDGTFQYTKWDPLDRVEPTAYLSPDKTFRIVCPTKSLAVHGIRFAYMLLPEEHRELIRYACSNLTGATGSASESYTLHLMSILNSPASNGDLVAHIRAVHSKLVEYGVLVAEAANPVASYYTFAKLPGELLDNAIVMDQRFFGIEGFDGYVRVNLLSGEWSRRYPGISGRVQQD